MAALAVAVLAGCGTTEAGDSEVPQGFPTIAPVELGGVYEVGSLDSPSAEDSDRWSPDSRFAVSPTIELDIVTGSLIVDTACNRYLGSFSLEDNGRASFTITGGTIDECRAESEAEDNLLLEVLTAIDRWVSTNGGLRLDGQAGAMSWTKSS